MIGRDDLPLERTLATALESREAVAFVHAGPERDPGIRYCRAATTAERTPASAPREHALAFDGDDWLAVSSDACVGHPAYELAGRLADRLELGTVLTPARIPHDAALYLERAGFALASTDALERARATKTSEEREAVAAAQAAAGSGVRRGAAVLADATVADGRLVDDGAALTADRLRRAIDEGIVAAGGFPAGTTTVSAGDDGTLRPGEPIVLATAPRGPAGYHGGLVRTLVVDGEGGTERRAHVGVTQAFRSAQAMLTADAHPASAVEADLAAEVVGFGFDDHTIETAVAGVGLEPAERPCAADHEVGPGALVRLEAAVEYDPDCWVRLADVFAVGERGVDRLEAPSRSLEPAALQTQP